MKIYTGQNVFDAALERIRFIYDEFPNVVCCFSGGKDSTVIFHLMLKVAGERGRLPLPVFFLDQESEFSSTIELMREVMTRPDVRPIWAQVPFRLYNATSANEPWMKVWDQDQPQKWIRPKETIAIKENVYGADRFGDLLHAIPLAMYKGQRVADVAGMRANESPTRHRLLVSRPKYKWLTWATARKPGVHYTFYPLYDWCDSDIWVAIHKNGWKYNKIYDLQYAHGLKQSEMRVSSLIHETAIKSLFTLQEFERETYDKMTQRLAGVHSAAKMSDDYFPKKLPFMFKSWREYRDFLVEKMLPDDLKPSFRAHFKSVDDMYGDAFGDQIDKACIQSVLANDYEFIKVKNALARPAIFDYRRKKQGKKSTLEIERDRRNDVATD